MGARVPIRRAIRRAPAGLVVLWIAAGSTLPAFGRQQPPPQPPPQTATPPAEKAPPAKPYHFNPEGRRDPFVSLVARGADHTPQPGRRIEGPAGLLVSEVALKGIVHSRGEFIAMIQGPDTKTFMVRANDRLLDGNIKTITADTLVIMQEVNDPLSLVRQREVRKVLRSPQEGK